MNDPDAAWQRLTTQPRDIVIPGRIILAPRDFEPLPPAPASRWEWTPNVRTDMGAIAWVPGSGDPPATAWLEDELSHEQRVQRRGARVFHANRRLDEMRRRGGEGPRFASVLLHRYVHIGSELERTTAEPIGAVVGRVHLTAAELTSFSARARKHVGGIVSDRERAEKSKTLALWVAGAALIAAAEASYERDEWDRWADRVFA